MIDNWNKYALSLLENNMELVVGSNYDRNRSTWYYLSRLKKVLVIVSHYSTELLVLTEDSRMLYINTHGVEPVGLKSFAYHIHRILATYDKFLDICMCYPVVIIVTISGVYLFDLAAYSNNNIGLCDITPIKILATSGIDLIAISRVCNWGFARTGDNLYWFGENFESARIGWPEASDWWLHPIEFHNTVEIKEIHCCNYNMILLMNNGSVYIQNFPRDQYDRNNRDIFKNKRFELVNLGIDNSVVKIVIINEINFCITSEGNCHNILTNCNRKEAYQYPILKGYLVENVYAYKNDFIIQHDGMKLSILPKSSLYSRDTTITLKPLPFFNDKIIQYIVNLPDHTLFITDEGHAYKAGNLNTPFEPIIERDMSFDIDPNGTK